MLEEIEEISNPKVRLGKKSLTPEQLQLKQTLLAVLDTVRDEAGKDAAVRLVFEPKTSRIDQTEMLNILLANTSLESSVSVNLVMVGSDGRPKQKRLLEILAEWIAFRLQTVTRRTQHRLDKVNDRIHILEGRQTILLHIDEVIRIIRESDEPKPALIEAFKLSDRQAEDILEIRLRQLARLETIKIEQELKQQRLEKAELETVLGSPTAMRRQVIKEIEADSKLYGDARRTLIQAAQRSVVEVRIVAEPVTVIVSERGWVRARQGHGHDWSQLGFKAGDGFYGAFEVQTTDTLFAVASNGKVYSVPVSQLPSARGDGNPISSFIELEPGALVLHPFAAPMTSGVLFSTRLGYGFICQAADLVGRTRQGKALITLEDADEPLRPGLFVPGMGAVLCVSANGRALSFGLDEMKVLKNGGRGVILMGLDKSEALQQAIVYGREGVVISGVGRGGKAFERKFSENALAEYQGGRARKGKLIEPRVKEARLALPRNLPDAKDMKDVKNS